MKEDYKKKYEDVLIELVDVKAQLALNDQLLKEKVYFKNQNYNLTQQLKDHEKQGTRYETIIERLERRLHALVGMSTITYEQLTNTHNFLIDQGYTFNGKAWVKDTVNLAG